VVELAVDGEGAISDVEVDGSGLHTRDPQLDACVAKAVLGVSLTGDARVSFSGHRASFTVALLRAPAVEPGADAAVITLTRAEIRVGARLLASEVPLDRDGPPQRAVWRQVQGAITGLEGPIVFRVGDDVDAVAIDQALRTFAKFRRRIRFARALDSTPTPTWKIVNPLGDIDLRNRCDGPPEGRVSVLVNRDGYWVATDKGYQHLRGSGERFDTIAFGRHLRELRRFELAGRSDLEIAGVEGTPYEALAKAAEIAFETGFTDLRILRSDELRDPRQRRRRPR
jgi:hypothetical protein